MDRRLFFKLTAIAFMSLLLLVPLSLIEDQVRQRSHLHQEVQEDIANSAAGRQTLIGPVLAIQYQEALEPEKVRDPETGRISTLPRSREGKFYLPPETLHLDGKATVETRRRGIYEARLFHLDAGVSGRFVVPAHLGLEANRNILSAEVSLVMGVSDPRGVNNDPEVIINGQRHRFRAFKGGASEDDAMSGSRLQVPLGSLNIKAEKSMEFSFPLQLTGTEGLSIAPVGEANVFQIRSDWPHPSFGGRFLPRQHEVGDSGFNARWEVSHLARNFGNSLRGEHQEIADMAFIDPVNVYLQTERAVKYGILFIALTFCGFFLVEILRRSPIHPMQYLLVGLALAIFFLLLIALSEHLDFVFAYGLAATACIALITTYLAGALGGWRPGLAFGAGLTGLYGVLYGVLLSEGNSLLMGSLLLFIALGVTMLTTRRLDWYRIGTPLSNRGENQP